MAWLKGRGLLGPIMAQGEGGAGAHHGLKGRGVLGPIMGSRGGGCLGPSHPPSRPLYHTPVPYPRRTPAHHTRASHPGLLRRRMCCG